MRLAERSQLDRIIREPSGQRSLQRRRRTRSTTGPASFEDHRVEYWVRDGEASEQGV